MDADDDDAVTDDDSVVTGDDDDVTAAGDNTACVSSDPDYTYEYSAGALTLFWSIVDSDTAVSVKVWWWSCWVSRYSRVSFFLFFFLLFLFRTGAYNIIALKIT